MMSNKETLLFHFDNSCIIAGADPGLFGDEVGVFYLFNPLPREKKKVYSKTGYVFPKIPPTQPPPPPPKLRPEKT